MKKLIVLFCLVGFVLAQGNVRIVGRDVNGNSNFLTVGSDGAADVKVTSRITDPVIVKFNKIETSTTLKADLTLQDKKLVLNSTVNADAGDYVILFSPDSNRVTTATILSVSDDSVFIDSPIDFAYSTGDFVDITTTNMAVNGSVTPQRFGLRGLSPSPVGKTLDIHKVIINCQTSGAVDLSKFGDIASGITNGLLFRSRNGRFFNIFNAKTNGELASLAYDWTPYAATNPQQGQNGFLLRLTFNGEDEMGVALRVAPTFDIEFLVQDDLSSITLLEIVAEGHFIED